MSKITYILSVLFLLAFNSQAIAHCCVESDSMEIISTDQSSTTGHKHSHTSDKLSSKTSTKCCIDNTCSMGGCLALGLSNNLTYKINTSLVWELFITQQVNYSSIINFLEKPPKIELLG